MLIEQVVEYYLTVGWDWSNATKDAGSARTRLQAALDAGEVFGPSQGAAVASAQARTAIPPPPAVEPTAAQLQATPERFGVAWARLMAARGGR
jgi:hypothetical protein